MKPKKKIRAWAGFCDDRLDYGWNLFDEPSKIMSIFKTKKEAKERFQDVRRVTITID